MHAIVIHILYWFTGVPLLQFATREKILSWQAPHYFTCYFFGLLLNGISSFILNQFVGISICSQVILYQALGWLLLASVLLLVRQNPPLSLPKSANWQISEMTLLVAIVAVATLRHANMLGLHLWDWDSLFYHLPFGEAIAKGSFPENLGRSYNREIEAAYPPLFFFWYARNVSLAWWPYLFPKISVIILNLASSLVLYHLACRSFRLPRLAALAVLLSWQLVSNVQPNIQSLTTLYLLLGIYYTRVYCSTHGLLIAALCWAGCYWANYLGLPLLTLALLALVSEKSLSLRHLSWQVGLVGLLIFPHLLRNFLELGNPLYPALWEVLGGKEITQWYLENRPSVGRPIAVPISELGIAFLVAVPMAQVGLAAVVALAKKFHHPSARSWGVFLIVFFVVWVWLLHMEETPTERFLHPIVPLALIFIWQDWLEQWSYQLQEIVGTSYLLLCCALVVSPLQGYVFLGALGFLVILFPAFYRKIPGHRPLSPISVWLYRIFLLLFFCYALTYKTRFTEPPQSVLLWTLGLSLAVGGGSLWFFAQKVSWQRLRFCYGVLLILAIGVTAGYASNQHFYNDYYSNIREDIKWMNHNLPSSALVLTMEDRLYPLDVAFLPADDFLLERFYQNSSPRKSLALLQQTGVTHLYFSQQFTKWQPWRKKIRQISPYLRVVYRREGNWVAQVAYPQEGIGNEK